MTGFEILNEPNFDKSLLSLLPGQSDYLELQNLHDKAAEKTLILRCQIGKALATEHFAVCVLVLVYKDINPIIIAQFDYLQNLLDKTFVTLVFNGLDPRPQHVQFDHVHS